MIEAAVVLIAALLFLQCVSFARWSSQSRDGGGSSGDDGANAETIAQLRLAIVRAERRLLGRRLKCLPRAMAMQWMLRRRRIAASLVIGGAPGSRAGRRFDLHAWIECGNGIAIGGDIDITAFAPVFVSTAR